MLDTCKNPGLCMVVVVEDDALLRLVITMELESATINSCSAANGYQALALLRSHHPKVLILDISIPGLSGFEVVVAIKQDPTLADLDMDLIVHSSQELSEEERLRITFGRTTFLTKTRVGKDLSSIVSQALACR